MKQEGRAGENMKIEGFWILSALLNQHLSTEVARITVQCQCMRDQETHSNVIDGELQT